MAHYNQNYKCTKQRKYPIRKTYKEKKKDHETYKSRSISITPEYWMETLKDEIASIDMLQTLMPAQIIMPNNTSGTIDEEISWSIQV